MAPVDAVMQEILCGYIFPPVATVTFFWVFRGLLRKYVYSRIYGRIYAWILDAFARRLNSRRGSRAKKEQLFNELKAYQRQLGRGVHVLELGSGSAANVEYFPDDTTLVCLDPNPYFIGYIKDNVHKSENVIEAHVCRGYAEKMPFPDEQFDAVVCTLVLCTVQDPKKSLAEVLRVLKPGGLFLYMEHVADKKGSWTWTFQGWLSPIWRVIGDGCELRRDAASFIKTAGFSRNNFESFRQKKVPFVLRPWILGTAMK